MSGSPIIQDGKLIGAITHVLVNAPDSGYGMCIENMREAAVLPEDLMYNISGVRRRTRRTLDLAGIFCRRRFYPSTGRILFSSRYWTAAPKGIRASFAILKLCKPRGIPTMVTQQISPITA